MTEPNFYLDMIRLLVIDYRTGQVEARREVAERLAKLVESFMTPIFGAPSTSLAERTDETLMYADRVACWMDLHPEISFEEAVAFWDKMAIAHMDKLVDEQIDAELREMLDESDQGLSHPE